MPLTTKELNTIRVQAIYFKTDHRFGPTMQQPSPVRILAELRGARFDVVHSQIAPTVLPHSQEDWQITDRATTDLLTAAGFSTRLEYYHACNVHDAAILNFYHVENA